jgi:UDP-2,3-diacylglucosamine pyrophosphatase LpxH
MSESKLVAKIKSEVERITKKLALPHASFLTKSQFISLSKISDWELRKVGGLQGIISSYFPFDDVDLKEVTRIKENDSYVNKLEKRYGKLDLFRESLLESMQKEFNKLKFSPVNLNEKQTRKHLESLYGDLGKHSLPRSVVAIASDLHFGATIDAELGGRNTFDWNVAAHRWGMFIQQIASYKIEARGSHKELHLLLLGDLIQGLIHDYDSKKCDTQSRQLAGLSKYLIDGVSYLQPFFKNIIVHCTAGNHDRMIHKASKDRAMIDRDDSLIHPIFYFMGQYFNGKSNVQILVPKTPYIDVTIQGHRLWGSHGDVLVNLPNPAKNLSTSKLEMQLNKINASEREVGKAPYEIFCFGHIHQPAHIMTTVGTHVIVNGCLVGLDQFAFNAGCAFTSVPTQTIFEVTKDYGAADIRLVYVSKADNNKALESIIKPYKGELV